MAVGGNLNRSGFAGPMSFLCQVPAQRANPMSALANGLGSSRAKQDEPLWGFDLYNHDERLASPEASD